MSVLTRLRLAPPEEKQAPIRHILNEDLGIGYCGKVPPPEPRWYSIEEVDPRDICVVCEEGWNSYGWTK